MAQTDGSQPHANIPDPATRLREALARLYPREPDQRTLVFDAGLDETRIAFDGVANNTWRSILKAAQAQGRLESLLDLAVSRYPADKDLRAAIDAYEQLAPGSGGAGAFTVLLTNVERLGRPLVGRDTLLEDMRTSLGDPAGGGVLVLHGEPGVGKSELAREYARRDARRYPGGAFVVDARAGGPPPQLAEIGRIFLGVEYAPDLPLRDQCLQTLAALARGHAEPADLRQRGDLEAIRDYLPFAGAPCHAVLTTVLDPWQQEDWAALRVGPLDREQAAALVCSGGGRHRGRRGGRGPAGGASRWAAGATGAGRVGAEEGSAVRREAPARPPAQGCVQLRGGLGAGGPEGAAGAVGRGRARLAHPRRGVRAPTWPPRAATTPRPTPRSTPAPTCTCWKARTSCGCTGCSRTTCADCPPTPPLPTPCAAPAKRQRARLLELAAAVAEHPNDAAQARLLAAYPAAPRRGTPSGAPVGIDDGETVGRALYEIGRFADALPWYERAAAARAQPDAEGRVDHASLGNSLHQVGYCLSQQGQYAEAQPWYERAVAEKEQGDVHGRIDHAEPGQ